MITTTGKVTDSYDDSELGASYSAAFTEDHGVVISVDVFRGDELLASVPVARYTAEQVDGFHEQ